MGDVEIECWEDGDGKKNMDEEEEAVREISDGCKGCGSYDYESTDTGESKNDVPITDSL